MDSSRTAATSGPGLLVQGLFATLALYLLAGCGGNAGTRDAATLEHIQVTAKKPADAARAAKLSLVEILRRAKPGEPIVFLIDKDHVKEALRLLGRDEVMSMLRQRSQRSILVVESAEPEAFIVSKGASRPRVRQADGIKGDSVPGITVPRNKDSFISIRLEPSVASNYLGFRLDLNSGAMSGLYQSRQIKAHASVSCETGEGSIGDKEKFPFSAGRQQSSPLPPAAAQRVLSVEAFKK